MTTLTLGLTDLITIMAVGALFGASLADNILALFGLIP